MTRVYVTIDTELSADHFRREGVAGLGRNHASAILGASLQGDFGIGYQMDRFEAYGLQAIFFVDPMPALVGGLDCIKAITQPILDRGHDVQLHVHTEWLAHAGSALAGGRAGRNIGDFSLEDQVEILLMARDLLMAAGAPEPVAFRAGNYGANDDTLRALAAVGMRYDSSFCPGIPDAPCAISLPRETTTPQWHCGTVEVPIAVIPGWRGRPRHAQLTAISAWEIRAAIDHAAATGQDSFTLVSHSFELMCRDRTRANRMIVRRFETLCELLASDERVRTATYRDAPPAISQEKLEPMPHNPVRTALRIGEQAVINGLYGDARPELSPPARALRERIVNPLHHMTPLQNLALDFLSIL